LTGSPDGSAVTVPSCHRAIVPSCPESDEIVSHSLLSSFRRSTVAANCEVCGKGPSFGHTISHSHRRTKRRWNPNIQRVRTMVGGVTPKRLNVCTSCLKAGKVAR